MSYKKQKRINDCTHLLSSQFRRDLNSVRINVANTVEHELAKCKQAYVLIGEGHSILTEAIFKNGCRADILDLCCFRVFEILHSEKEKEALTKKDRYPPEVDIILLRTEEVLK